MIICRNVNKDLQPIYDKAVEILEQYKDELLKYNDSNSIAKEMYKVVSVDWSPRANSRRGVMKYVGGDAVKVEISKYMQAFDEKEILTTMVHELLHCFKDSNGHKGNWLWRANYLSKMTGLKVQRTRPIENEFKLRAEYDKTHKIAQRVYKSKCIKCQCERCGYTVTRERESKFTKFPYEYFHRGCGGKFMRVGD